MTARVAGAVMGRPSTALQAERLRVAVAHTADLADEVRALHAERGDLADEIEALSRRAQIAIYNDRPDIVLSIAGRLDALAESLRRRNAA